MDGSRGLRRKIRKIRIIEYWPELLIALALSGVLFFLLILFTY